MVFVKSFIINHLNLCHQVFFAGIFLFLIPSPFRERAGVRVLREGARIAARTDAPLQLFAGPSSAPSPRWGEGEGAWRMLTAVARERHGDRSPSPRLRGEGQCPSPPFSSMKRKMFSRTTIASSITMPTASASPPSVMALMVWPGPEAALIFLRGLMTAFSTQLCRC